MKSYVLIDIETSNLTTREGEDQLIKIDAIKVDKNVNLIDEFHTLIIPRIDLSDEVEKLIGLTNKILKRDGIMEKEALEKFLDFIKGSIVISHNASYMMASLVKGIFSNNVEDHEIYYYDLLRDLKMLGIKKKTTEYLKEYFQIKEDDYLSFLVAIVKKILEEYRYKDLEEYNTKNMVNRIRFPGLCSKTARIWVCFSKGNTKDSRRIIEFVDDTNIGKIAYFLNYRGIKEEILSLEELIMYRKMGATTIDDIFYFDSNISPYISYYKVNSHIKIESEDIGVIKRLEEIDMSNLKENKIEIICDGTINELRRNYAIIEKEILDKIISCIIAEI